MKGIKQLAVACFFLAGFVSCASATEMSENILKLSPLVYFGAENFEQDEIKGLNRGTSNVNLEYIYNGEEPDVKPSFLGEHAGQSLSFNGQEPLRLRMGFLADVETTSASKVLGFSLQQSTNDSAPPVQCLLLIGDKMALVLNEGSFNIYTPGSPESPQIETLDIGIQEERPLTVTFSRNQIEISNGFDLVWEGDVPEGVASLANDMLTVGNCSTDFLDGVELAGFHGQLDELTVLDAPALSVGTEQSSVVAGEGMAKATLSLAARGFYPLDMQAQEQDGLYGLDAEQLAIFAYPQSALGAIEYWSEVCDEGESCTSLYSSDDSLGEGIALASFHGGDGFYWLSPIDQPRKLDLNCSGSVEDCAAFRVMTGSGKAFGKPKSLIPKPFSLLRDDLPDTYDRSLNQLSLRFSNDLTDVDVAPQPVSQNLLKLYLADESENWIEKPITGALASGKSLTLTFQPWLKDGHYRLVIDQAFTSFAGVTLAAEQSYEFTVASAEVLITSNTTISAVDFEHEGKRLIVDGATLTLSGEHTYESVLLRNSAVLTSPVQASISLTAGSVEVDASSRIDVSAKGKQNTITSIGAWGGGSYGGKGGAYSTYTVSEPYGDFREPRELGSGGRNGSSSFTRGGGAFELQAETLNLDGLIQANGQTNTSSFGSGSGGSLLLRVGSLTLGQQARIEANGGGTSGAHTYGGGGGGRVALYYGAVIQGVLPAQVLARGGLSYNAQAGAAGSIYLKDTNSGVEELLFNNEGRPTSAQPALLDLSNGASYSGKLIWNKVSGEIKGKVPLDPAVSSAVELVVDNATLTLAGAHAYDKVSLMNSALLTSPFEASANLRADTVEVDASSRIDVSAKGKENTITSIGAWGGGSYGGKGGAYSTYTVSEPYGDFREPRELGSGGRNGSSSFTRGGGAFELQAETLNLDGLIQANGQTNTSSFGSGSGGSLLLRVGSLTLGQQARIEANGGGTSGAHTYGGGGGGRVALYYGAVIQGVLPAQVLARGGLSYNAQAGAAGSIYLKDTNSGVEELLFNNEGRPTSAQPALLDLSNGASYSGKLIWNKVSGEIKGKVPLDPAVSSAVELVVDNATLTLAGAHAYDKVSLMNSALLTSPFEASANLRADTVEVDASSRIDVSAKGKENTITSIGAWGGGSYGGKGGAYSTYTVSEPYGDFREPRELGSGGRNGSSSFTRGGGAFELQAETLNLDGLIQANGQTNTSSFGSGSGGSLLLRVGSLTLGQQARIEANGGGTSGAHTYGGGGGGRVALYYGAVIQGVLPAQVLARGGLSYNAQAGAAGSIYLKDTNSGVEELLFNNEGRPTSAQPALLDLSNGASYSGKLIWNKVTGEIKGQMLFDPASSNSRQLLLNNSTLTLSGTQAYQSVLLRDASTLTSPEQTAINLSADTVEVDATSKIDVSAKGSLPSLLVGAYSGGSHGGLGGRYSGSSINPVYGNAVRPDTFGLGGHSYSYTVRGGGALSLVARVLKLDGKLLASGDTAPAGYSGGGAGGSLWINAQSLIGSTSARLLANGGNGLYSGGAGGGGRIALYYSSLEGIDVLSQISVAAGATGVPGGVGSLHLEQRIGSTAVLATSLPALSNGEIQSFNVDFINALATESVNAQTVQLHGPSGLVPITGISLLNPIKYQFELAEALSDGDYELRIAGIRSAQGRGMDQNGNAVDDEADDVFVHNFKIDRAPPQSPQLTAPLVAPAVNGLTVRKVTISGSREDETAVLVNGVEKVVLGSGVWNIPDHPLVEGQSELQVQVRDGAGNLSPVVLLKFSVDSLSPTVQQVAPTGSIKAIPASVWLRFGESGSGLDFANSSMLLKRGGSPLTGDLALEGDILRLTPSSALLEGSYSVEYKLKDQVGNLIASSFTFSLDYTPPPAPVVASYPSVTTNKVVRLSFTKEAGGSIKVRNGAGMVITTVGFAANAVSWNWDANLIPGDNTFTFEQTDAAGNVSQLATVQIRFDDQAPGPVAFTIDPNGSGTELKLAWAGYNEVANGSDIKEYRVYSAVQAFSDISQAQLVATIAGGTKLATLKSLPRDEERFYAVVAVDQQGLLVPVVTSIAGKPVDVQPPENITGLVVQSGADRLDLSWQPSSNSAADLSGYALYVGSSNAERIDLPLADLQAGLRYSLTDLDDASAYPLRLVSVDAKSNESTGVSISGVTWLPNPAGVELEAVTNRFDMRWAAVQPSNLVSGYRVYVSDAPFTSVQGMTPRLSTPAGQPSTSVAGLTNNQTYHVAVTTLNSIGGENPTVQSQQVKPVADAVGPEVVQLAWVTAQGSQDVRTDGELSQLGELRLQATDESGIGRIEWSINGQPMGAVTQAGNFYRLAWDVSQVADGYYALSIKLYDTLDNLTETNLDLEVDLAAPGKPVLALQSKVTTTNAAQQVLLLQGQPNTLAEVRLNDEPMANTVLLNGGGQAQLPITLLEGENTLEAALRYASRSEFGELSAPLLVTLDTSQPNAPKGLQASAKPQAVVQLNWAAVSGVKGYNLYAANQPFNSITDGGVSKVNTALLTATSYQHKPAQDGTYYYRLSAVNALGSESNLSNQQTAVADRVLPLVEEVQYSSLGVVASDGRHAPGRIDVRLRMNEPLRNAPFFSLDVPEGASVPLRMTQSANDPLFYQGSFDLTSAVPSGLLYARLSAYDPVGNEGTEVRLGNTLRVDTQGPDVQQLSLLPEHPLENIVDAGQGREVQVVLRLSDEPSGMPTLIPQLNGQPMASQAGAIELVKDGQSQPGMPVYTGRFRLPVTAGAAQVDLLGFSYQAQDDLGNTSQRIQGRRDFQVYQGTMPPLDTPQGLAGKVLSAGRVALNWKPVTDASAYQIYRRAEADSQFTALSRVRTTGHEDNLPVNGQADGVYFYQVASIREHEGKEALSLPSEAIRVEVDSQAPSAPRALQAELNGAGIVLRWQAPAEAGTYTYNLYRSNTGQGQTADLTGRTPLQSKIPALIALDSRPSATEHSYTLTAVDSAGNESAPAEAAYLNAGLLPVSDLRIDLPLEGAPSLSWAHNGSDVAGYNVYLGNQAGQQKLNSSQITAKAWQDQGVALPVTGDRLYSVTAVDAQGVESLPHSLLLPALGTELRPQQTLQRGLFNQLYFHVSNDGSQEIKRVRLQVALNVAGQTKVHESELFDVAAGSLREVPVVVAGYPELPGVVPLSLTLVYAPQVGETVTLQQSASIDATEGALLVQLQAGEFTRGGNGSVRLRLENPSAVATELVTARASGTQASDEMRLILEDLQGNVLASEPIKAALGNGLITVRDGRSVIRVGAQDVLEAGPFSIKVPSAAPDQVRVRLEADFLHYQTGLPGEQKIKGLRSSQDLTLSEAPYVGELTAITPEQVQAGDTVVITGRALKREDQQPLANVELKVVLGVRGFEEVVSVTTDANGQFSYARKTDSTDSGEHQVSVIHPILAIRPQQGHFTVQGASFTPASVKADFPRNYEQLVTIVVEAGYDSALKNLRLEYVQPSGSTGLPAGIKAQASLPLNLAAKARGNLTLRISGDNNAAATGLLDYRIVADGLSRPIGQTRIQYSLVEARPVVRVSPAQLRTGLARDTEQVEAFSLSNSGLDVLRNPRITLLNEQGGAAPAWLSLRTSDRLGDVSVGGNSLINVAFKPGAAVTEGDYFFTLRIESDNHPQVNIPIQAAVTQSGQGGVIFQVEDIYTGTLDDAGQRILGLKGARIKLQNRNVLSSEFTGTSDSRGQVLLENIPAGEYSYRISAWDHDDLSGNIWIKPGLTQAETVFLMSKLVTVEWSVKEIALQDRYEVILNATFKTKVPTALVLVEPLAVNLPAMRKGDVFQGELTLTNYGLVRADNVTSQFPSGDARARFEYLRAVPQTLEAGEVVVIPYRVVALQSFDPDDVLNGAAGCWNFNYPLTVRYASVCANGTVVPGQANMTYSANGKACTGGLGGGGASGWGGWGGSGGGGFIPRPTPLGTEKQCPPPVNCESGDCPKQGNGGPN